jgi:hypothetical protein
MDIGSGIAIAGVWIGAAIFGGSDSVTNVGALYGVAIATVITVIVLV